MLGVADIAISGERAGHIHVALVGEGLHEVELMSLDVAEMDVEDLGPLAEPADHREDLARRVIEHLGQLYPGSNEPVLGSSRCHG